MGFSMDGFRKVLIIKYNELHNLLQPAIEGNESDLLDVDVAQVKEAMREIRNSIGFLCCVYYENDKDFTDISEYSNEFLGKFKDE